MTLNEIWNELIDETIIQIKAITELKDTENDNGFTGSNQIQAFGFVVAYQFKNLQPGDFIDSFDLDVITAAGNIRIKIYGDNNDTPNILLGESNSLSVSGTGLQNFRMEKQVEVPSDGIIWCAFETDTTTLDLVAQTGLPAGTRQNITHTYGTGPDPFGSATSGTTGLRIILHTKPIVVKHYGMRGTQPEDYFGIVSAGNMETASYTNRGSINKFEIFIDLSYRGADYRDGLTKVLKVASDIYDILHRTTLNSKCRQCDVTRMDPAEIEEGKNLYLTGVRVTIMCEKAVIQ